MKFFPGRNKLSFLIILCFLIQFSYAGINDSIPEYILNIKDTAQISELLEIANQIRPRNMDSALILYKYAENAALSIGDEMSIIKCKYVHAVSLFNIGKYKDALVIFKDVLKRSAEIPAEEYIFPAKVYIGTIYMFMTNYNLALEYNLEGLEYYESEKNYEAISGIYLNLTFIQIEQKDTVKAMKYAQLAYQNSITADHKVYQSKSLLNIGELYLLNADYDRALFYFKKSLAICEANKINSFIPTIQQNIGSTYFKLNIPDSAKLYFNYVIQNEINPYFKSLGFLSYSELYEYYEEYEKAIEYAKIAEVISIKEKLPSLRSHAYSLLAKLYAKKREYKKAYEYKISSGEINDSIFSDEKYRIQNELEAIYENSKKQKAIDDLSKENEISKIENQRFINFIYFLAFIILLAVIIAVLLIRQNKIRSKQQTIELEQKLLRTQMNPHFIFNSISAIQDFIMSNNAIEASSYLSDFAKLMRAILTNSSDNLIPLEKEIETVEHYLKLQHLRLSDKFDYSIEISKDLDQEDNLIPPMLLQPFIENSIKHGILKKSDGMGLIAVRYYKDGKSMLIETEDNGVGRKKSQENINTQHRSKAIEITNQRINLLSREYNKKITFEIHDLISNENKPAGTLVRFILPLV